MVRPFAMTETGEETEKDRIRQRETEERRSVGFLYKKIILFGNFYRKRTFTAAFLKKRPPVVSVEFTAGEGGEEREAGTTT
ncbi:MAG: hypothetical protein IT388_03355 [Nitrospirales bacterium]|nr:hypothetical protein [Nitrospirales bacterium]